MGSPCTVSPAAGRKMSKPVNISGSVLWLVESFVIIRLYIPVNPVTVFPCFLYRSDVATTLIIMLLTSHLYYIMPISCSLLRKGFNKNNTAIFIMVWGLNYRVFTLNDGGSGGT